MQWMSHETLPVEPWIPSHPSAPWHRARPNSFHWALRRRKRAPLVSGFVMDSYRVHNTINKHSRHTLQKRNEPYALNSLMAQNASSSQATMRSRLKWMRRLPSAPSATILAVPVHNTMCSGIVRPPIKVLVWLSFCELGSFAHGRKAPGPIQQPVVPAVRRMMDNALRKFPFASSGFLNPVFDASLLRTCM